MRSQIHTGVLYRLLTEITYCVNYVKTLSKSVGEQSWSSAFLCNFWLWLIFGEHGPDSEVFLKTFAFPWVVLVQRVTWSKQESHDLTWDCFYFSEWWLNSSSSFLDEVMPDHEQTLISTENISYNVKMERKWIQAFMQHLAFFFCSRKSCVVYRKGPNSSFRKGPNSSFSPSQQAAKG